MKTDNKPYLILVPCAFGETNIYMTEQNIHYSNELIDENEIFKPHLLLIVDDEWANIPNGTVVYKEDESVFIDHSIDKKAKLFVWNRNFVNSNWVQKVYASSSKESTPDSMISIEMQKAFVSKCKGLVLPDIEVEYRFLAPEQLQEDENHEQPIIKNNFIQFSIVEKEADLITNFDLADVRNKLSPLKNLVTMIENGLLKGEMATHDLLLEEIKQCKESIKYLSQTN